MTDEITLSDIEESISQWEEAITWIARGWDCHAEYTHDLWARHMLNKDLEEYLQQHCLPDHVCARLAAADDRFRAVTQPSRLSVWDCTAKFCYLDDEHIALGPLDSCHPVKNWYFYRWQPDCPISWQDHDLYSYQKEMFGLDFENMSEEELLDVVRKIAAEALKTLRAQSDDCPDG